MEKRNIIAGFELGEKNSQITIYDRKENNASCVPVKVGGSDSEFATALSKKEDSQQWHFGREAQYFAAQQQEILVDNLYELCRDNKEAEVGTKCYKASELLAVFLREGLRLAGISEPSQELSALMVTVPGITRELVENVRAAFQELGIARGRGFLQDYDESFYYYTLYQRPDIWSRKVGMFLFEDREVSFKSLDMNDKTRPVLVSVGQGERMTLPEDPREKDSAFQGMIERAFGDEVYSSVFLMGDGFSRDWAKKSVLLLCRHRRHVFMGNNLYVKGACYAAKEKIEERMLKGYLFVSRDLVRHNIGMEMTVNGSNTYYLLIPAGINWYEAVRDVEILLNGERDLTFSVSSMDDGTRNRYSMELPGLPERPDKATRLHLHLEYISPGECTIEVRDEGFGELFPSSGLVWKEIMRG